LGFTLNDRTLFDNVRSLSGGHAYRFKTGKVLSKPLPEHIKAVTSRKDFVSRFNDHVSNSAGERPVLPVTGGIDSRMVLSAFIKKGMEPTLYTHGNPSSQDFTISQRIAEETGLEHIRVPLGKNFIHSIPSLLNGLSGGLDFKVNPLYYPHIPHGWGRIPRECTYFTTTGGGVFRDHIGNMGQTTPASLKRYATSLVNHMACPVPERMETNLNRRAFLKDEMILSLASLGTTDAYRLGNGFLLKERVGNFASHMLKLAGQSFFTATPFLQTDFLRHSQGLLAEKKRGGLFQMDVIKQNAPQLAKIPFDSGRSFPGNTAGEKVNAKLYRLGWMARCGVNRLAGRDILSAAFVKYPRWYRTYHQKMFTNMARQGGVLASIPQRTIEAALEDYAADNDRYFPFSVVR